MSDSEDGLILHLSDDLLDHLIGEVIHAGKKTKQRRQINSRVSRGSETRTPPARRLVENNNLTLPQDASREAEKLTLALRKRLLVDDSERLELLGLEQRRREKRGGFSPVFGKGEGRKLLTSSLITSLIPTDRRASQISSSEQQPSRSRLSRIERVPMRKGS